MNRVAGTTSWRQLWPRRTVITIGWLLALAYVVLLGGTVIGELSPPLWVVSAGIGATVVALYTTRAPTRADRVDRIVVVALLLFVAASVLSNTPRQSFDAALLVLVYAATLFVGRGLLASASTRVLMLRALCVLSGVLTLLTAARWIPQYAEWWNLTDRMVIPPLNFEYAAVPWGHRYDLTLAILLLAPAWWVGPSSVLRRAIGTAISALAVVMVVITGSRGLWLAVGVATIVLGAPHALRAWRSSRGFRVGLFVGAFLVALALVLSGALALLVARATNLETVSWRSEMWGPLIGVWASDPLGGYGPGSLPWILQLTGYFDANSWAPRHPDSVPVQLLAEVGLLGVGAVAALLIALVPPILRSGPAGVRWALTVFLVASLLSSPTEFPYLVAIVLAWVAFAVPRSPEDSATRPRPHRVARFLGVCAAGIVAVAYLVTIAAAMSYDRARVSIDQDTVAKAGPHLDAAIAADPSLALYHRQRGIVAYLDGDSSGAVRHLRRASELNPSDDLAFRALGLAYEGVGNPDLAGGALTRAVELQRSDVTNVLLLARWHALAGRADMASELLVEVVMSAPAIVAAPAWAELVGPTVETRDLLEEAAERWAAVPAEEPLPTDQALWLAVLADRQDLLGRVLTQAGTNVPMAESTVALLRCEPADRLLAAVEPGARQAQEYWSLRLWADASAGRSTDRTLRILAIMRGDFDTFSGATGTLNPLNENGATSADVWGYRRYPIQWPETPIELPSPVVGLRYWLTEPRAAVREAGLQDRLPGCD